MCNYTLTSNNICDYTNHKCTRSTTRAVLNFSSNPNAPIDCIPMRSALSHISRSNSTELRYRGVVQPPEQIAIKLSASTPIKCNLNCRNASKTVINLFTSSLQSHITHNYKRHQTHLCALISRASSNMSASIWLPRLASECNGQEVD